MAYQSWSVVFGEQPSAAKWNILGTNDSSFNDGTGIANLEIGSGHTSLKNDYKFSVYRTTAWTSSGSLAVVLMDTKIYDTSSNVDIVTNKGRFTVPVTGFYHFSAQCTSNTAANAGILTGLYKNGVQAKLYEFVGGGNTAQMSAECNGDLSLAASDYVEVYHQGSVSTGGVGAALTFFDGFLISNT